MILKRNCHIDFRTYHAISSVWGFSIKIYNSKFKKNTVNILSLHSILVNIDIISWSYVNVSTQPTIYSFFPNISPGYKIIETPVNLVYLPITLDTINSITVWLTDQNWKQFNLQGYNLSIRFHLRKIKKNILLFKNEKLHKCQSANIRKAKRKIKEGIQIEELYYYNSSQVWRSEWWRCYCHNNIIMAKACKANKGMTIKMSKIQLAHNMKIEGGFLPALAGLILFLTGTVLPTLGVRTLSGLASTKANWKWVLSQEGRRCAPDWNLCKRVVPNPSKCW